MIQDIAPHTYHNEYKPVAPDGRQLSFSLTKMERVSFIKRIADNSITLPTFPRTGRKRKRSVRKLYLSFLY